MTARAIRSRCLPTWEPARVAGTAGSPASPGPHQPSWGGPALGDRLDPVAPWTSSRDVRAGFHLVCAVPARCHPSPPHHRLFLMEILEVSLRSPYGSDATSRDRSAKQGIKQVGRRMTSGALCPSSLIEESVLGESAVPHGGGATEAVKILLWK